MYLIYSYKSPSNKYYIGITNNESRRKQEHRKKEFNSEDTKFSRAVKKYGFNNLEYTIIDTANNQQQAKLLEIHYIKKFNSYKDGYNSTPGGDLNITQGKLSESQVNEIRELISSSKLLIKEIAELYDVSSVTVSEIKHNKRWKHQKGAKMITNTRGQLKGSQNSESKLTENEVKEIKVKLAKGVPRSTLQIEYGVSKTNIQMIATGRTWSHVKIPEYAYTKIRNGNAKLDENTVRSIWKDRDNYTQINLAKKYNVSRSTIQNIFKGKIWNDIYNEFSK